MPATVAQTVVDELKAPDEDFRQMLIKSRDWVKLVGGALAGRAGIFEPIKGMAKAIVLLRST